MGLRLGTTYRCVLNRMPRMSQAPVYQSVSTWTGQEPLSQDDPDVYAIIKREKEKQRRGLAMIPSEVSLIEQHCSFTADEDFETKYIYQSCGV